MVRKLEIMVTGFALRSANFPSNTNVGKHHCQAQMKMQLANYNTLRKSVSVRQIL